jgi:diguanylate cyclase (GGDEF)-like protein
MTVQPAAIGTATVSRPDVFPGAFLRVVAGPRGVEVLEANTRAGDLLHTTVADLTGTGFADGFFEDDALVLAEALAEPDEDGPPLMLRWGDSPPVTVLGIDLQGDTDGTVLVALHDRSDQFLLDAIVCGQSGLAQVCDSDGVARWISPQSAATIGMVAEEYVGRRTGDLVHPDDLEVLGRAAEEMAVDPDGTTVAWYRVAHPLIPDAFWTYRSTLIDRSDDPAIGGIISISKMVVSQTSTGVDVRGPTEAAAAEMMPSGFIVSGSGRLQFHNSLARRFLGPAVETSDPYGWLQALRDEHRRPVRDVLVAAAELAHRNTVVAAVDGPEPIWLRIAALPSFDAVGTHVGYAATLLDVTAEHTARQAMESTQEEMWHVANHDGLTGLPNRMQSYDRLESALARTRREGRTTALLFCDLDHFKQVNDDFGHAGGDALLVEVARRLGATVRETDTVGRLGGDEFVVICEAFEDRAGLEKLAARLTVAVNEPVPLGSAVARVGLCVGIAVADRDSTSDALLARADAAVYLAKNQGRNRYIVAR